MPDGLRRQALLGLGSSYRNVLRHRDAIALLEGAAAEIRSDGPLKVVLALALWSGGRERDAFATSGRVAVESADLGGYGRAASYYLDHLD